MDIYELMEFAQREMQARLLDDGCTDDWQWNDHCFQFVIIWNNGKVTDPYRFCYDEDEEFFGTAEEQVLEWMDERF